MLKATSYQKEIDFIELATYMSLVEPGIASCCRQERRSPFEFLPVTGLISDEMLGALYLPCKEVKSMHLSMAARSHSSNLVASSSVEYFKEWPTLTVVIVLMAPNTLIDYFFLPKTQSIW